jgi:putative transcriptional regulator
MARMTLEQIKASHPRVDDAKLDATTEADIQRHMREDGEDPDAPLGPFITEWPAAAVRARVGMSQSEFARALHIPVATLRNWEQGRVRPDPAAQSLLRIVASNPEAAFAALAPRTGDVASAAEP